jgi:hypothetical protein
VEAGRRLERVARPGDHGVVPGRRQGAEQRADARAHRRDLCRVLGLGAFEVQRRGLRVTAGGDLRGLAGAAGLLDSTAATGMRSVAKAAPMPRVSCRPASLSMRWVAQSPIKALTWSAPSRSVLARRM